ncbi:MAG: CopY family transcriptional regulator [Puniceicoccaceae bacterium]|nr:CopY family transcriptional regulator [Puniceicoccaceae bacterium]|tara:strand:- start:17034 stop:17417 length:384 start_codon:yes stop_codon:yes gene_type:complete
MKKTIKPTPLESKILSVLWKHPSSNVREVNAALDDGKERAYTTVLTSLQLMERKGLVSRKREGVTDWWRARVKADAVARPMLTDLVKRMLGGKRGLALQYLLEEEPVSGEELDELQSMIDAARKRNQ